MQHTIIIGLENCPSDELFLPFLIVHVVLMILGWLVGTPLYFTLAFVSDVVSLFGVMRVDKSLALSEG